MRRRRKRIAATALIVALSISNVVTSYAGWQQTELGRWKYQDSSTGWRTNSWFQDIDGTWYRFNEKGEMLTGWFCDVDGTWYYLHDNGAMNTGWLKDASGNWYFMNSSGKMLTGLANIDGEVYYFNPTGEMFIGEKEIPGEGVFYFTEQGTTNGQPYTAEADRWTSAGVNLSQAGSSTDDTSSDDSSSDWPERPDTPDKPDEPDTPDTPDTPDKPDIPDKPDTPDGPDEPDNPDNPDEPDKPDTPSEIVIAPVDDISNLFTGSEKTLTVTVTPETAEIQVSSSDENVVKAMNVANLITLTAVGAGTAEITVTASADGYEAQSAVFQVTVTEKPQETVSGRQEFNFNTGWMFAKGVGKENSQSEVKPEVDVAVIPETEKPYEMDYTMGDEWVSVSLPHTYNDVDTFDNFMEEEGSHHGERSMYTGTAWYKKEFTVPESYADKKVFLEFEAARQAAHVYINGQLLEGVSENGFIPFGYDLTPYLEFGKTNQITVMVDNSFPYYAEGTTDSILSWHDSHWHPTHGGLYRNANLFVTDKLHVTLPLYSFLKTQGTYVYTENESEASADVFIETEVKNDYVEEKTFICTAEILDMDGGSAASVASDLITLQPGESTVVKLNTIVHNPIFWSDKYPYLYQVESAILLDDEEVDASLTPLGIRVFRFTNDFGMYLNEHYTKLQGWGQKSTNEWAGLGAAYPDWMHDYVIRLMKDAGGNFIRWGHTAGSPTQIGLSDKYGMVVEQPGVDGEGSTVGGKYSDTAYRVRKEAFRDMIIYYRNNPSIVMWELGNQSMPDEEAAALSQIVAEYDHHGKSASAVKLNSGTYDDTEASSQRLTSVRRGDSTMSKYVDVGITTEGSGGMNTDALKNKPEVEGEYNREEARRGVWDRYTEGFEDYKMKSSTYNLTTEQFAVNQVSNYKKIARTNHCGGANWIFSDSTSHGRVYSEVTRASGEVDAVMLEKEAYYALKTIQTDEIDAHIIGHWNYAEGTVKPVYVASDAEKVELFLNGESLGFGKRSDTYLFTFADVAYEPGTLLAVGYDVSGNEVCRAEKTSHGEPYAVRLTPIEGPQGLLANGSDVLLIDAEVVDAEGKRCLNFDGENLGKYITFDINDSNGCSIWRGGYNSGIEHSTNNKHLYIEAGITRVAVRTTLKPGTITVSGHIDGLQSDEISLESQAVDNDNGLSMTYNETYSYSLDGLNYPGMGDGEKPGAGSSAITGYKSRLVDNFSYSGTETKVKPGVVNPAAKGEQVYTDNKNIVFEDLPLYLVNEDYFQLPNKDSGYMAEDMVSFGTLQDVTVYVAHDDRISTPEWLTGTIQGVTFADTAEDITIDGETYSLYSAEVSAGESVTLSSNAVDTADAKKGNMYTVFVTETGRDDEFFEDDFEGQKLGDTPAGWIVKAGEDTSATVVEDDGNQVVQLYDTNTSGTDNLVVMAKRFLPQAGRFSVEWKLYDNRMADQNYVRFILEDGGPKSDASDKSDWAVESYLNTNGALQYRYGTSGNTSMGKSLDEKTWYTIKYVVDMRNKTFDAYVDDVVIRTGMKFVHDKETVNSFIIGTGASKGSDIMVDDIKIEVLEDRLESLEVNGVKFDEFDADQNEITLALPEDFDRTQIPAITAEARDYYAEVEVTQPADFESVAEITVTAQSGQEKTYQVKFGEETVGEELEVLLEEDFEGYAVKDVPDDWDLATGSNATAVIEEVERDGETTKVVRLEDTDATKNKGNMVVFAHPFDRMSEKIVLEYDVKDKLASDKRFFRIILHDGEPKEDANDKTGFIAETYITEGKLVYRNAGSTTNYTLGEIKKDQWYTIKYVVDFLSGTYDVYMDGVKKGAEIKIPANLTSADYIIFATGASYKGDFLLDNIKVSGIAGENSTYIMDEDELLIEDITVNGESVGFDMDTESYEMTLAAGTEKAEISVATASDAVEDIKIDGVSTKDGARTLPIDGERTVKVEVVLDGSRLIYQIALTVEEEKVETNDALIVPDVSNIADEPLVPDIGEDELKPDDTGKKQESEDTKPPADPDEPKVPEEEKAGKPQTSEAAEVLEEETDEKSSGQKDDEEEVKLPDEEKGITKEHSADKEEIA